MMDDPNQTLPASMLADLRCRPVVGRRILFHIAASVAICTVASAMLLPAQSRHLTSTPGFWAILAGLALVIVSEWYRQDGVRWGSFFCTVAALHLVLGFVTSGVSLLSYPRTQPGTFTAIPVAFKVVSVGFSCMCLTYVGLAHKACVLRPVHRRLAGLTRAGLRARMLAVATAAGIFMLLAYIGFVPLFHRNPLSARFTLTLMAPEASAVVRKLGDIAALCAPVVPLSLRGWRGRLPYLFALAAVALTASRMPFLLMVCAVPISRLLFRRRSFLPFFWFLPGFVAFIVITAGLLKFGNQIGSSSQAAFVTINNFGEVAGLAYTIDQRDVGLAEGRTYIADAMPVPTIWSTFKRDWSLNAMTGRIAGFEVTTGGLRITGFGEGFFNFGMVGVVLSGAALGWLMAVIRKLLSIAFLRSPVHVFLLLATGTRGFAYLYLSGTGGVWDWLLAPLIVAWLILRVMETQPPSARSRSHVHTSGAGA